MDSPFLSVYVNFTKECRIVSQKRTSCNHSMSRDLTVKPLGLLLDDHVIPLGQTHENHEFPASLLCNFQAVSYTHLTLPTT